MDSENLDIQNKQWSSKKSVTFRDNLTEKSDENSSSTRTKKKIIRKLNFDYGNNEIKEESDSFSCNQSVTEESLNACSTNEIETNIKSTSSIPKLKLKEVENFCKCIQLPKIITSDCLNIVQGNCRSLLNETPININNTQENKSISDLRNLKRYFKLSYDKVSEEINTAFKMNKEPL